MIVDSLVYLGESLHGPSASADDVLRALDAAGIDRAIAVPARPPGYHLGPANDALAAAVAAHPDRLTGLARVDPQQPDASGELARALDAGLVGLFLHPWEETFRINAPLVDPVVAVAAERGVPVVIAAGYPWLSEGLQVGDLAGRFPDATFVATNGGQINISGLGQTDVELALTDCPNLSLQTAGVYREDFLELVIARYGRERLLFSSHFPLLDPRLEVKRGQWLHLPDDVKADVLGANAARVFGL